MADKNTVNNAGKSRWVIYGLTALTILLLLFGGRLGAQLILNQGIFLGRPTFSPEAQFRHLHQGYILEQ